MGIESTCDEKEGVIGLGEVTRGRFLSFSFSFLLSLLSSTGLAIITVAAASSIRLFSSEVVNIFPLLPMRIPVICMTLSCSRSVRLSQDFMGFSFFSSFAGPNRRPEVDGVSVASINSFPFSGSSLNPAVDAAVSSISGDWPEICAGVVAGAEAEAVAGFSASSFSLVSSGVGW